MPLEGPGRDSFPASAPSWGLVGILVPQLEAAALQSLPLLSCAEVYVCVWVSSCLGTSAILDLGPALLQGDRIFNEYICKDPISK